MNLPQRKSTRLKNYNYNQNGYYFITICTHNHKKLFSDIVGAIHELPENKLNHNGKIADYYINKLNSKVGIKIDKYIIMPNHIHLILIVENNERSIRESTLRKRSLISNTIGYLKMNISKEIHKNEYSKIIWQRSFHDHIIRNEQDYLKIWEYIDTNPIKWFNDCFYVK